MARAFTLIELLVVVAIISILAAIAVPNFLAAQTRSKVSRVRSDLRTLATAIEAYSADHQRPPYDGDPGFAHFGWVNALKGLTTPVAYLAALPTDVFQDSALAEASRPGHTHYIDGSARSRHSYDYSSAAWEDLPRNPGVAADWARNMGNSPWKLSSAGPDLAFVNAGSYYGFRALYDPTNGTASDGDLLRTAANTGGN
ncbi:MAG: prepilin-type N-terminal cleavage/methylation domain-containing protein [Candidatus Sumerlaeia bacterium]|nr:prepilin-type N-terminal cleavage/methylation domain-containing protein [Candidatus Sumerlaeia bacterium]